MEINYLLKPILEDQYRNKVWRKVLMSRYLKPNTSSKSRVFPGTWNNIKNGLIDISKATKCRVYRENRLNHYNDNWVPQHETLQSIIQGPTDNEEEISRFLKFITTGYGNFINFPSNCMTVLIS